MNICVVLSRCMCVCSIMKKARSSYNMLEHLNYTYHAVQIIYLIISWSVANIFWFGSISTQQDELMNLVALISWLSWTRFHWVNIFWRQNSLEGIVNTLILYNFIYKQLVHVSKWHEPYRNNSHQVKDDTLVLNYHESSSWRSFTRNRYSPIHYLANSVI